MFVFRTSQYMLGTVEDMEEGAVHRDWWYFG